MKSKEKNGSDFEYQIAAAHQNKVNILNRRIADLEKGEKERKSENYAEILRLKNDITDCLKLISELISYKKGLEKENREIKKNQIPMHLRNIDSECLSIIV